MDITFFLAIWGAALSSILGLIEVSKFLTDKAYIIVKVEKNYSVSFQNNQQINEPLISISVANRRQRPITISQINLYAPLESPIPVLAFLNKEIELSEGKSYSVTIAEDKIKFSGDKCVASVVDVTGRYFWSHNFIVRWMKIKEPYRLASRRFKWLFKKSHNKLMQANSKKKLA